MPEMDEIVRQVVTRLTEEAGAAPAASQKKAASGVTAADYPILQKHRFLTPIMEVRRWGKLIFCGHLKRTAKELEYNRHISAETASEMRKLLKNVGL